MNQTGARTVLPSPDTAEMADLAALLGRDDGPLTLVGSDGLGVPLPEPVRAVLAQATVSLAAGKAVTVAPLEQRLTTQQAADLLGVSRPTLVKILNRHEIPYEQPGRQHRRIRLVDVLDYRERRRHGERNPTVRDPCRRRHHCWSRHPRRSTASSTSSTATTSPSAKPATYHHQVDDHPRPPGAGP